MNGTIRQAKLWTVIGWCLGLAAALNIYLWLGFRAHSLVSAENYKHLTTAYRVFQGLESGDLASIDRQCVTYPPLVYTVSAAMALATGEPTETTALVSIAIFVAILAYFSYALASLCLPKSAAVAVSLCSTAWVTGSIQVYGYMLDEPLAALVCANLYYLAAARGFSKLGYSFGFALTFALGMLTKFTFPIYVLGPLLVELIRLGRNHNWCGRKRYLLSTIVVAAGLVYPWYSQHFAAIMSFARTLNNSRSALLFGAAAQNALDNLSYAYTHPAQVLFQLTYPHILPYLALLGAVLFALGFVRLNKHAATVLRMGIAQLCLALLVLSLMPNSDPRYLQPLLPMLAILALVWTLRLGNWRYLVILPCMLAALVSLGDWALPRDYSWFGQKQCKTRIAWQDPLGIVTSPKLTSLDMLTNRCRALDAKGLHLVWRITSETVSQPSLALLQSRPYIYLWPCGSQPPHWNNLASDRLKVVQSKRLPQPNYLVQVSFKTYRDRFGSLSRPLPSVADSRPGVYPVLNAFDNEMAIIEYYTLEYQVKHADQQGD